MAGRGEGLLKEKKFQRFWAWGCVETNSLGYQVAGVCRGNLTMFTCKRKTAVWLIGDPRSYRTSWNGLGLSSDSA